MSRFITIIRPEFMEFCKDACRSAAFNHLLFRIAGKSKDQPKEKIKNGEILWYAKTEQITEEMANAWGTCKVRKEVNALINMGIIGRQSNPAWGADRTKHFCFGQKECKKFLALCEKHKLCIVHLGLPPEVVHLIYLSNANDTSIKCICPIHQMQPIHLSDAFDISIRAIPIDRPTIEEPTKEEDTRVAFAFAHAPLAPSDFLPEEHIVFEHYAGNETLYYHSACVGGHYGTSEGMILTVVSLKQVAQEACCGMCQSNIHQAPFSEETHEHDTQASRPAADHDPLPGSSTDAHAFVGATADVEETAHRIPAIKIGANNGQLDTLTASASIPGEPENSPLSAQTRHSHIPSSLQGTDGAATEGTGRPRASGKQDKPKRTRRKPVEVQLTLHEQEVKEWYEELRGVDVSFSKKNVTALQALGKRTMTKDDFLNVTAILDGDTWFEEHKIGVDLYWIERQWENKIIFLQRKKPPLADKKPLDVYTAASLDPERNKRNLERLKANRLAKEAAARQGGVN